MKFLAGCVAVVVAFCGLIWLLDSWLPNSTAGITIVDNNTARLPQGETFVLTHQVGKVTDVWRITYDGNNTVHLDKDAFIFGWGGDNVTGNLCGVGCTTDVDMGWGDHFYLTLRQDGAVDVKWPWGWDYRPPKN